MNGSDFYCGNSSNGLCQLALTSQIPAAYVHPAAKQCNYVYTHPTSKQCNWEPSMDGYMKKTDLGVETVSLSSLAVGTIVNFGKHSVNGEAPWMIPWRIIKKNHSGYPSGSVTLIADQCIDIRAFDAQEPNNSDSGRRSYGNNNWRLSNIRLWLNSAAASWYTAQHSADASPTNSRTNNAGTGYDTRPGFLYNFTAAERNLILSTTITTVNNTVTDGGGSYTTTDKIFLPSETEMGLGNENNIAEGTAFGYFTSNSARTSAVYANAYRYSACTSKPNTETTPIWYWLRTPNASNSDNVRIVNTDGSLTDYSAYLGYYGVRPCLNLPGTATVTKFREWYDIVAG